MSFRRTLTFAAMVAALVPGTAAAEDVRIVSRDEPLGAVRSALARPAPLAFTMVGVHWQGSGEVWFRTARAGGRFGPWRRAQPEEEDTPDVGSSERRSTAGWNVGNPWWTGAGRRIQYRLSGSVTRLRTFFISSPVTAADRARAASGRTAASIAVAAGPVAQPPIIRRSGWNADESIVRRAPSIADRLRRAVVHHTAGSNSYSPAASAAIVRGIQRYHVLGNGWDDIGYNFLIDKYGRIFEGRGGGITQNVIGAHAGGFNTGSVGVSFLGTYESASLSTAARRALQNLLAWRLDVGHVFPRALVDTVSAGSSRWPAGTLVRLRAISGHRDTSYTSCPGNAVYGQLGTIARIVTRIGLPKLYDPEAEGSVGDFVRFTGRLSASRTWLVQVKDAAGTVVAQGGGTGTAVNWTWDATAVPIAFYTYTMSAGPDVRPATFRVPGPPPLAVTRLRASPRVLTPNGDWSGEQTTISFGLTRRSVLGVRIVNAATGSLVRTLLASAERPAGARSLSWDGTTASGAPAPDGSYRAEVSAEAGVEQVSRSVDVVVDRTLGGVSATPALISPNGDGRLESLDVGFELTRQASVRVQFKRSGKVVRTVLSDLLDAGPYTVSWNGRREDGRRVADGLVKAVVLATTSLGTRALGRPVRLDTTRPVVRVLSLRMVNGVARLRFSLSEPAQVHIWYGRRVWSDGDDIVRDRPAGVQSLWRRVRARVVRIVAVDEAMNRSAPAVFRALR